LKNWPGVPGMKLTRHEHRDDGEGGGDDGQADGVGAFHGGLEGPLPRATRFSMFSISTMASSTRMPMTRVRASRVTTFSEKPITAMKKKVGISDTGMAMAVIRVARHSRRNRNTTRAASSMPSSRCAAWRGSWRGSRRRSRRSSRTSRRDAFASSFVDGVLDVVLDGDVAGLAGLHHLEADDGLAVQAGEAALLSPEPSPTSATSVSLT
jgi:hypothetical protein